MLNAKMNLALDQLPESDFQRLLPDLKLVSLQAGDLLYEPGSPIEEVIFPVTSTISIAVQLSDGCTIDTSLIGCEGIVGVRALEFNTGLHRVYVAHSGLAYAVSRTRLLELAKTGSGILNMFLKASLQTMRKITLEMACNYFHTIDQRLAKWILNRSDIFGSRIIQGTHQSMAESLGVRREAISYALHRLPGIVCHRGYIEVNDLHNLEEVCCECYFLQKAKMANQLTLPFD